MADPFLAEIRVFPFNFAPKNWAFCNGQLLPISQNTALFSLLGTMYGGDGKSTFGLPNLQGNVPIHMGQGPGLSLYDQGQTGGTETVTLLTSEIPPHSHRIQAASGSGDLRAPSSSRALAAPSNGLLYAPSSGTKVPMDWYELGVAGQSLPHENMAPSLALNFCIAMQGVFPPRS